MSIKILGFAILVSLLNLPKTISGQLNKAYFYNLGRNQLANEQYAEAILTLNQLLRADTTIEEAWFLRGVAKYNLNDFQGARFDFGKAITNNPVFSQAYLYRAIVLSRLSRYSQAISDFDMAIDLRPSFSLAYFNRGIAFVLSNDPQRAINDFSQTIKLEPKNIDAWINRGTAKIMNGDSLGALTDYRQAIQLNPFYSESYSKRGRLYYELGDMHLALTDFDKAIECDTTISLNYFYRALVNNSLHNTQEAIKDLNKTITLNPENALSLYNRGLIYWQSGNSTSALVDFNRVTELNPENILIYYNRGVLNFEMKKFANSIKDFSMAINLFPDFANAYLGRSAAHAMLGNRQESFNDKTFAQSIAEKFKDNHALPWTDTTKKFDKLIAFSSDFSPKTAIPLIEAYGTHSIDIKPFLKTTYIHKDKLRTRTQGFDELDKLNSMLPNSPLRFIISSSLELDQSLGDSSGVEFPFVENMVQGIKSSSKGKFSEAINYYKRSLQLQPNNPLALLNLAVTEAEMLNFIASFEKNSLSSVSFEKSIQTSAQNSNASTIQSVSFDEPLENLVKLESLIPNHYAVYYNKANIFAFSGEMEKAIESYTMACNIEPDLAEAWYNRGLVYLVQKNNEMACRDLGIAGEKGIKQAYLLIHRFCRK